MKYKVSFTIIFSLCAGLIIGLGFGKFHYERQVTHLQTAFSSIQGKQINGCIIMEELGRQFLIGDCDPRKKPWDQLFGN